MLGLAVTVEAASPPLPADITAEVNQLFQPWQFTGEARSAAGYDDNIYLSPGDPLGGAFLRGELEAYLLRLPVDKFSGFAFLTGNSTKFFSGSDQPSEEEWYGELEAQWRPIQPVQLSVNEQGSYEDQVFDLSAVSNQHVAARLRVKGDRSRGRVHWAFYRSFWLESDAQTKQDRFHNFDEDFIERAESVRLGWTRPNRLELSLAFTKTRRDYAEREKTSFFGLLIPGTHLDFYQRDGQFRLKDEFDWRGHWTATTTLGYTANRDNGLGYYDFDEKTGEEELEWDHGPWKLSVDGIVQRYVFSVQLVGTGISPTPRLIEDYDESLRLERSLGKRWNVFIQDHWERSRSNEEASTYRVNTALAGTGFSF
jgi:hypothetical protein